jgi:hypothetical protein
MKAEIKREEKNKRGRGWHRFLNRWAKAQEAVTMPPGLRPPVQEPVLPAATMMTFTTSGATGILPVLLDLRIILEEKLVGYSIEKKAVQLPLDKLPP